MAVLYLLMLSPAGVGFDAAICAVCRRYKLRPGPPEPHHHDDSPLVSARQPAAARPASRAFCPDLLPQHAPRPCQTVERLLQVNGRRKGSKHHQAA